jgi:GTP-binding protein
MDEAVAGDIVLVTGIDDLSIGCTITDTENPKRCRCCASTSRH